MQIVIAGFGNLLRRDDGFGIIVLQALEAAGVPDGVTTMDVGIGGIHLVQHLLAHRADALIILDALDMPHAPGTVLVVEPDIVDVNELPVMQKRDQLADMHYATPDRALMLARAMDALPDRYVTIGCVPIDANTPDIGLTPELEKAVPFAVEEVRRWVRDLGVPWPAG